jgi:hypothetical protein
LLYDWQKTECLAHILAAVKKVKLRIPINITKNTQVTFIIDHPPISDVTESKIFLFLATVIQMRHDTLQHETQLTEYRIVLSLVQGKTGRCDTPFTFQAFSNFQTVTIMT